MLLSLNIENWKSFKNKNELSLYSSLELQHGNQRAEVKKFNLKILPITAIFGGNAAGKSNLISALFFLKNFILEGVGINDKIKIKPFLLDDETKRKPTTINLEMLIDELIYSYSITLNKDKVLEESLFMKNSRSEHMLFTRVNERIEIGEKFKNNRRLKYVAKGTQNNKSFITNSVEQKLDCFSMVYNWFMNLVIISPDIRITFPHMSYEQLEEISLVYLNSLDTGIKYLELVETDINTIADVPRELLLDIEENLNESSPNGQLINMADNVSYRFEWASDKIKAYKYMTVHEYKGKEIRFDLAMESEGSKRVIELIPLFYELSKHDGMVLVVDELDRSLHTQLTRSLIEMFLDSCNSKRRNQLIFTTHDIFLMDQDLLRRDEMYLVERNRDSESKIFSIFDFPDVRIDSDIRKLYLNGRFGGNPKIMHI